MATISYHVALFLIINVPKKTFQPLGTIKLLSAGEPDTNNCPLGLHETVVTGL